MVTVVVTVDATVETVVATVVVDAEVVEADVVAVDVFVVVDAFVVVAFVVAVAVFVVPLLDVAFVAVVTPDVTVDALPPVPGVPPAPDALNPDVSKLQLARRKTAKGPVKEKRPAMLKDYHAVEMRDHIRIS